MRVFFALLGLMCVTRLVNSLPRSSNPECPSMQHISKSLEKALSTYTREKTTCPVNNLCSGLMCNGTHHGNDFFMRMELKQCDNPPKLHLDLKYPAKSVDIHRELTSGTTTIAKNLELRIRLERNKNILRAKAGIYGCVPLLGCKEIVPLLKYQTICLNMNRCQGYNTSQDVPCSPSSPPPFPTTLPHSGGSHVTASTPTTLPHTKASTAKPRILSTKRMPKPRSTANPKTGKTRPTFPVTGKTGHFTPVSGKTSYTTGAMTTPTPGGDTPLAHKKARGHHMSVGMAAGIGVACVAGVLVVIGALFYYRRFRRSRLRAAYYNDISMNDPLYEDFGPEVA